MKVEWKQRLGLSGVVKMQKYREMGWNRTWKRQADKRVRRKGHGPGEWGKDTRSL